MTTLREAAQQALEALEWHYRQGHSNTLGGWRLKIDEKALRGLKAVLAEPLQEELKPKLGKRAIKAFEAALAQVEKETAHAAEDWQDTTQMGYVVKPYTAPPQRKPLTHEEIVEAVRESDLDWQAGWTLDDHAPNRFDTLARAIERAHGIGEKDE